MSALSSSAATVGRAVILIAAIGLAGYLVVSAQRRAPPSEPPVSEVPSEPASANPTDPPSTSGTSGFGEPEFRSGFLLDGTGDLLRPQPVTNMQLMPDANGSAGFEPTFLPSSKFGAWNETWPEPPPVFLPSSKSRAVDPQYLRSSKSLGPAVDPLEAPAKPVKP